MKKIILFSMTLAALNMEAQNVNIPDTHFKKSLVANTSINTNSDTEIQVSEAAAVKRLDLQGDTISNLTGIEAFTALTYFICDNNKIVTLDLHANTHLDTLSCAHNLLVNLDVSALTSLVYLYCPYISTLVTFKASSTPSLKWFDIGATSITTLDLSKQTELTYLDIVLCSSLTSVNFGNNTKLQTILSMQNTNLLSLDVSLNSTLTTLSLADIYSSSKSAMTICVSPAQKAAIPTGWSKNSADVYSTTNCLVGINEVSGTTQPKTLLHIYNLSGQEVNIGEDTEGVFIYQYSDGSVQKIAKL